MAKEHPRSTISDNLLFKNANGEKIYLSGVNYWPRSTGPLMWSKWNPEEIRKELIQMKQLGMNLNRSFLYIPDFMPTPDKIEQDMLSKFNLFLDMCSEENILTIPTFFVGHMSGEEWDFPWRNGRSLYEDEYMLERQALFVKEIVNTAKDHKSVIGWLFSNEMPNHGGEGPRESVKLWVKKMTEAVRSTGDKRPISPGDGAWSPEIWGNATKWYLNDILDQIDFIGPHIYPFDDDTLRHSYNPAFAIKMATALGKPAILEEFGASNTMASEENQGAYFRTTLNSVFLNGGVGALGWCYSDFNLEYQRPYSHRGYELQFGVTRADGTIKPSGEAFIQHAKLLKKIDLSATYIHEDPVAILIPTYYHHDYDYTPDDSSEMKNNFKQCFIGLKQNGINPHFIYEPSIDWSKVTMEDKPQITGNPEIIFSPATARLTAPYWRALIEFVEKGGWLYISYKSDGWIHLFEELFGAKHNLKFGFVDLPNGDLNIKFIQDFGTQSEGDSLKFNTNNLNRSCAYCPVDATEAEVIALDADNRPALLMNKIGKGRVIFSTYPLEYYVAMSKNGSQSQPLNTLYGAICAARGIDPPLKMNNSNVEMGILKNGSKSIYAFLVNHSWNEEKLTIRTKNKINDIQMTLSGENIQPVENSFEISLAPKNIELLEIWTEEKMPKRESEQSIAYMEE